jgi:hypothetical protein
LNCLSLAFLYLWFMMHTTMVSTVIITMKANTRAKVSW